MVVSLTAFSQKDTTPKIKCFPIPVVKLIAKDLVIGDSAKALLKITERQLDSTIRKTYLQDSVIGTYKQKIDNYDTILSYERNKFNTLQGYTNKLEIDLKTEKVKTKFLRWGSGALLLCLGVVAYILK